MVSRAIQTVHVMSKTLGDTNLFAGAPFQWAAIFHKSDLTFDRGAHGLSFYSSAHSTREYEVPTKVSCSFCRTPIMDEGRNVCLISQKLLSLVIRTKSARGGGRLSHLSMSSLLNNCYQRFLANLSRSCHIFYDKRCIEILDGKTKWSGMDEESDLVDDYGNKKSE